MTHAVLFICSMNVCRSPLMQWSFTEGLRTDERSTFKVFSRGVNAVKGKTICEQSGILMHGSQKGRLFAQSHLSTPLTPADLQSPDLVIVATRAERGMLARYAPALRSRTFTLREANLLAVAPASPSELASAARAQETQGASLPLYGFPHLLHRRRGTLVLPKSNGWKRTRADPLDVPDAHIGSPSAHGTMLRAARTETQDLASKFLQFRDQISDT